MNKRRSILFVVSILTLFALFPINSFANYGENAPGFFQGLWDGFTWVAHFVEKIYSDSVIYRDYNSGFLYNLAFFGTLVCLSWNFGLIISILIVFWDFFLVILAKLNEGSNFKDFAVFVGCLIIFGIINYYLTKDKKVIPPVQIIDKSRPENSNSEKQAESQEIPNEWPLRETQSPKPFKLNSALNRESFFYYLISLIAALFFFILNSDFQNIDSSIQFGIYIFWGLFFISIVLRRSLFFAKSKKNDFGTYFVVILILIIPFLNLVAIKDLLRKDTSKI